MNVKQKSSADLDHAPVVREDDAGVHVDGVTGVETQKAFALLHAAQDLQFELGSSAGRGLLRAVLVEAGLELTPPAAVEQARRLSEMRQTLLSTPAYTYETLGEVRGDERGSTTRTWVSRMRKQGRLFTVRLDGRTIIPAFQLGDTGEPRAQLRSVLESLLAAGVDGWALWTWLTNPTPLLSGATPVDLVEGDEDRVARAASRFAARRTPAA